MIQSPLFTECVRTVKGGGNLYLYFSVIYKVLNSKYEFALEVSKH